MCDYGLEAEWWESWYYGQKACSAVSCSDSVFGKTITVKSLKLDLVSTVPLVPKFKIKKQCVRSVCWFLLAAIIKILQEWDELRKELAVLEGVTEGNWEVQYSKIIGIWKNFIMPDPKQ